jgi:ribonuclease P protein component
MGYLYNYSSGYPGAIYFCKKNFISKSFTLGKNERLKSRKLIEQLFSTGKSFSVFPYRVVYLRTGITVTMQAGFGASGKNFKKAVDRNRIKRLTREAYRLQKKALNNKLEENNQRFALFFIYTGKDLPAYTLVYEKMGIILQKLITIADEINIADT